MKWRMFRCGWAASLCALFAAHAASASPVSEFYIEQALDRYFVLPDDARTLSMGGASAETSHRGISIYTNPAGLGEQPAFELSGTAGFYLTEGDEFLSDERLEQNDYRGHVIAAFPLGAIEDGRPAYGALAVGFSRYDGHTDDSLHTTPDGHRRSIAYGVDFGDVLNLGYSFTFYDDQLHNDFSDLHSHSRILHIWGIEYRPTENWELGTTFRLGIGQSDTEDFRFNSNGLSHLRTYLGSIGAVRKFSAIDVSAAFDYSRVDTRGNLDGVALPVVIGGSEQGNVYNIRLGVETEPAADITLRGGFRWHEVESYEFSRPELEGLDGQVRGLGWSAGIGYVLARTAERKPWLTIDYGVEYVSVGHSTWEHLLTLNFLREG